MKIQRTINGTVYNIELLPEELTEAYFEHQEMFDIEDIVSYGEELGQHELEYNYGCTYSEYLEHKEEMADEMRRNMDKYDMPFAEARKYAIQKIMKNKVAV